LATHNLAASPATVHWGYFEAALKPKLTVRSGDRVRIETVSGAVDVLPAAPFTVLPQHRDILEKVSRRMVPGHILTGPVAVEGTRPGDVLEIRVHEVELTADWGWNVIRPLMGTLPEDFPDYHLTHIGLDRARMRGRLPWGGEVPLQPFFGVMGVAPPAAWGTLSSVVPRAFGGNLDCKELGAGAVLLLPVFVEGALFSAGDGHATQGDGEVNVTAIETCLAGTFELTVRRDLKLDFPRAETASHHITFGIDPVLDAAAKQALRGMIALICERRNLSREEAYTLCSLACDLHVTQLVNQHKGVHAMLPKSVL